MSCICQKRSFHLGEKKHGDRHVDIFKEHVRNKSDAVFPVMIQSIKHISHKIKTHYTFYVPFFNVTHSILFKNGPRAPQRPLHLLARAIHTRVSNVHEEEKQTYQLLLPYKNVCGANDSSSKPFILLTDTTAADLHGNNH